MIRTKTRHSSGCGSAAFFAVAYFAVLAVAFWSAAANGPRIWPEWFGERIDSVEEVDPEEVPASGNVATGKRSSRWDELRDAFVLEYPECAACGSTERLNVHHVLSFSKRPDLELEWGNLITLCRVHHFSVGHDPDGPAGPAKPNWKFSNPNVREDCEKIKSSSRR